MTLMNPANITTQVLVAGQILLTDSVTDQSICACSQTQLNRISPRNSYDFPNPEEPEGEEEDVQVDRMRTSSALTVPDTDEVELLTMSIRHVCNMRTSRKYTLMCAGTRMHNFGLKLGGCAQAAGPAEASHEGLIGGNKEEAVLCTEQPGKPVGGSPGQAIHEHGPRGAAADVQAMQATFRNMEKGTLLTTHYMAEAEAMCDCVAILVSGRLRFSLPFLASSHSPTSGCIGSIQHLKSKFGKGYLLEMKVKRPAQVESLHGEMLRLFLFPQAACQERYSSLMVYKLPVEDVRPLSQAFFKLKIVKQSFDLEEYSLSQSALEQVFLELSKEQELEDFDEKTDLSVKWKLLPQEEP
ncbi:Atp-Binding Cassette Sub-Family A Member 8 [Manis pentadactyla]|nr:Atp-Binding Cassette Sub-Family A Member 8 [Manis pentadactyla]